MSLLREMFYIVMCNRHIMPLYFGEVKDARNSYFDTYVVYTPVCVSSHEYIYCTNSFPALTAHVRVSRDLTVLYCKIQVRRPAVISGQVPHAGVQHCSRNGHREVRTNHQKPTGRKRRENSDQQERRHGRSPRENPNHHCVLDRGHPPGSRAHSGTDTQRP